MRFLENPKISDYTDYEPITRITNTLKNKEKSVKSFFQICVIRERKASIIEQEDQKTPSEGF
jgi:hypothetical protein